MEKLAAIAAIKGYFTRADVLAAGLDDRAAARALRSGIWVKVRWGTYTFSELWPATPEQRQRIKARAVAAKLGPTAVISHTSAAVLHGLRVWDVDLDTVHVTRCGAQATARTEHGIRHHRGMLEDDDIVEVDGLRVTSPVRAALETTSIVSVEHAVVVLDSLLQRDPRQRRALDAGYEAMAHWPGMQRGRVSVLLAHPGGHSVGESRLRYLCYSQSIPAFVPQFEIRDERGVVVAIADGAWVSLRRLIEFDGKEKYLRFVREGEQPGDVVFREKRREDVVRRLGWEGVIRVIWLDLFDPPRLGARIKHELGLSGS